MSLAVLILGRDVALSISAFYFRYISLPEPVSGETLLTSYPGILNLCLPQKTFKRYWDFSIPSAEVKPTQISKVSERSHGRARASFQSRLLVMSRRISEIMERVSVQHLLAARPHGCHHSIATLSVRHCAPSSGAPVSSITSHLLQSHVGLKPGRSPPQSAGSWNYGVVGIVLRWWTTRSEDTGQCGKSKGERHSTIMSFR